MAIVAVKRAFQSRSGVVDPATFPVLHHLAVSGPSRQGLLADALGLDASTISRHVRNLVSEGLVDSVRDPQDGRATLLTPTDNGLAHLAERLREHRENLRLATRDFSAAERAELIRLLDKLTVALGSAQGDA